VGAAALAGVTFVLGVPSPASTAAAPVASAAAKPPSTSARLPTRRLIGEMIALRDGR
jgi:hypothetical protein